MNPPLKEMSGWGRYPRQRCALHRPERYAGLALEAAPRLARGQGRSYGDAALNEEGALLLTERLNRLLAFDEESGVLRAEAGTTLEEILAALLPRGWFLPVTPGTRYASLGGCIAADVHGKNHHVDGTFSRSVRALELFTADGVRVRCSPEEESELFWSTAGGMGLTGAIGEVELQLERVPSAHIRAEHRGAGGLEALYRQLAEEGERHTVAWIDCLSRGRALGRGVVMAGRPAEVEELPAALRARPHQWQPRSGPSVPFDMPSWLLNPLTIGAFNGLYYRRQTRRREPFVVDCGRFFYPLDGIGAWNRLYGKRGFLQYQCVLPEAAAFDGLKRILERVSASGRASFLAVLKRLGPEGQGPLSFPMAGYTLAMDFPYSSAVLRLLDELDEIVVECGGRLYLAKDARLSPEHFRAMYPRLKEWLSVKERIDPEWHFSSSLSRRLRMEVGA